MPKPLILCDLDRTLFDTGLFFEQIWDFAALRYGLNAEAERERAPNFYRYYGDFYDYQFFAHVQQVAGDRFERDEFIDTAITTLSGRYLFADITTETIGMIDAILTFGNEDYQSFKLSLCPELNDLKRHIIMGSKGQYIARTFPGQPCVLIDDKPLEDEIRPPARFLRIDRTKGMPGAMHDFSQLPTMLGQLDMD